MAVFGCASAYDDSELRGRVEKLEAWQKSVNDQIVALQGLVAALESNDYVTSVTALDNGTGYVVMFSKSGSITIKHGEKGATPVVSVKQDADGKYYWTLDGEYITDGEAKIPATGDKGEAPRIEENGNWWIGTTDTGVKAQGDAIFAADGIDISDPNTVTFTLADGTTIVLPRVSEKVLSFDSFTPFPVSSVYACAVEVLMSSSFKEADVQAITATIEHEDGITSSTRVISGWNVSISKPEFENGIVSVNPIVTIMVGSEIADGVKAVLTVSTIGDKGQRISVSRLLVKDDAVESIPIGDNGRIVDPRNLVWLSNEIVNGLETNGKTYTLISDIDMVGVPFTPIASGKLIFKGVFEGNFHVISNLEINSVGEGVGLFGNSYGKIRNLRVGGNVTHNGNSGSYGTGGIVGVNNGGGQVINCHFKGNVTGLNGDIAGTGGVVGWNQNALVMGCSYSGDSGEKVTSNKGQGCGGVVGINSAKTKPSYVIGCYNSGEVNNSFTTLMSIGGVVGINNAESSLLHKGMMVACYNVGSLTGNMPNLNGGITGKAMLGTVTACFNTQDLNLVGSATPYLLGICDHGIFETCFWSSESVQTPYLIGSSTEGIVTNCAGVTPTELRSSATVTKLNAAIDAWNAANGNLCEYEYEFSVYSPYPILVGKLNFKI